MQRFLHLFSIPCIVLLCDFSLWAAGLQGRALDENGSVIPGVTITLYGPSGHREVSTLTDTQGRYDFQDLRPGDYLVQAEIPGFRVTTLPLQLDDSGSQLDIRLAVAGLDQHVVVTATGSAQLPSRASRSVLVISKEELERRRETNLGQALAAAPGIRVQRLAGPGSTTSVRFRGLRDTDTSLLINGFPIRDPGGFRGDISFFLGEIMLADVDRIELLQGASSNLYGTGASGGVINLIPTLGTGPVRAEFGVQTGSLELFQEHFKSSGSIREKFRYSLGAIRTDVNAGLDGQDVFRNTSLGSFLEYQWSPNIQLSGMLYLFHTPRLDLNADSFPIGPPDNVFGYESGDGPVVDFVESQDDPDSRRDSDLFSGVLNLQHRVSNVWSYSLYFQDTETDVRITDGPQSDFLSESLGIFEFAFDRSLTQGSSRILGTKHYLRAGDHNLFLLGLEREWESRSSQFAVTLPGPEVVTDRQQSTAFFVQDQIGLADQNLQINASFRVQFFSVENPQSVPELQGLQTPNAYTGGLSLSYFFPGTDTKVHIQGANGFRAPSLSERFATFESSLGLVRVGNPLLRPERSLTLDTALEQFFFDQRLHFKGTYFYNRLQEIISSTNLFQQTNAKGGLSRGTELLARAWLSKHWNVHGNYTYTNADFVPSFATLRSDNTFASANLARPIQGISSHQWVLGVNGRYRGWRLNLEYLAASDYPEVLFSPNFFQQVLFDFEGYHRLDLNLSYRFLLAEETQMEIFLKAENLLDDLYFEDGFRTPGLVIWGGVRWIFR